MIKKILILLFLVVMAMAFYFFSNDHRWKLASQLLTNSLEEVKQDYAQRSCQTFSPEELKQGSFDALVTGYCQPQAQDFVDRHDFLCAVGLNCNCPQGRQTTPDCAGTGSLSWSSCLEFDDQTTDYCHQTASQITPEPNHVAADWQCFPALSTVVVNDQQYIVTDKGSAITGRRFDIWFDNCQDALRVLGIYPVQIPNYD